MRKKAPPTKPDTEAAQKTAIHHAESSELITPAVVPLFDRVAAILDAARGSVVRAVNSRMVFAYWLIGREIVQELQGGDERAEYGKQVISELSHRLTKRYGQGYSPVNLAYFRRFHLVYADRAPQIFYALREKLGDLSIVYAPREKSSLAERKTSDGVELHPQSAFHPSLSWTHYRSLMQVEKPAAREFYEAEAVAAGWNTRELDRQIHSLYYERLLLSPHWFVAFMKYCKGRVSRLRAGSDGAFTHMSTKILQGLEFPYPGSDLQNDFGEACGAAKIVNESAKGSEHHLNRLFSSLQQRAFRGELDLSRLKIDDEAKPPVIEPAIGFPF